ncbi:MAG: hypothetical protein M1826_002995 [Phylliscum demangeonii]|nr:MAG: hypothetical protein M1826_002995 [Phylliscum demangeonii]
MHRHLCAISAYPSERGFDLSRIPANASVAALAAGLATAHKAYGTHKGGSKLPTCVLMLVQDEERNVFDQRHLEYELLERHQVPMFRLPFSRITQETDAHDAADRALIFRPPHGTQAYEVSVVYFRAGYSPDDYQDAIPAWIGRYRIERSAAIKCPSVLTHLAGCKKIQQVLASPSSALLERFLPHHTSMRERVRQTFTSIYPLDDSAAGRKARRLALDPVTAQHYVLKPQREGGGNNIYRGKIPAFLRALPQSRWKGYILMEIIEPPPARNTILRNGRLETGAVISELGVYGVCLWRQPWRASLPQDSSRSAHDDDDGVRHTDDDDGEILYNDEAGYLLRTKGSATEEGGIAAGFGCVDSCWLVDS